MTETGAAQTPPTDAAMPEADGRAAAKAALRKAAFARRREAHAAAAEAAPAAAARLIGAIEAARAEGRAALVAGYAPIRTEIDPTPAMAALAAAGLHLCLPVVEREAAPLSFRRWSPGCAMIPGAFGAAIPADPEPVFPDALIVPLVAFDRRGMRLGYGGGFYDRTLEMLRAAGPVLSIGFAYAAQEDAAPLPVEPTDQPLDLIVTEVETIRLQG